MKGFRPPEQLRFSFDPVGVGNATVHGTDSGALLLVVEADALGAAGGIDLEAHRAPGKSPDWGTPTRKRRN